MPKTRDPSPKSRDRELFIPSGELREEFEWEVLWELKEGSGLSGGEGEWSNGPRRILSALLGTDDSVSSLQPFLLQAFGDSFPDCSYLTSQALQAIYLLIN